MLGIWLSFSFTALSPVVQIAIAEPRGEIRVVENLRPDINVLGHNVLQYLFEYALDKDELAGDMDALRRTFSKSIVARVDLEAGISLDPDDLTLKKPGGGLPATKLPKVIGRRLKRAKSADDQLTEEDLE